MSPEYQENSSRDVETAYHCPHCHSKGFLREDDGRCSACSGRENGCCIQCDEICPDDVCRWCGKDQRITGKSTVEMRPEYREDGIRTRADLSLITPAELAIFRATQQVEYLGASKRLTDAVNLLNRARDLVADHVEGKSEDEDESEG